MSIVSKVMQTIAKAAPDPKADDLSGARQHIGQPINRLDGSQKVTGTATFTAEYDVEHVTYAALVYSTIAKGRITGIDSHAAERAVGVIKVISHQNALPMKAPPSFDPSGGTDAGGSRTHVFNTDEVYWNGQPVAVVIGDTLDRAEYAASLVRVTYAAEDATTSFDAAKADAKRPKTILGEDPEVKKGDAEAALAAAPVKVDQIYTTPRHNHNALELHATIASWTGDKLTIHEGSQFIRGAADTLAKIFSINKEDVHVISPFVGGGFGGKGAIWNHTPICAMAAKMIGRPVKLAMTREGVYRVVGGRTLSEQRVALGARENGELVSLIHTGTTAESPKNEFPEQFSFPARHLYSTETLHVDQAVVKLNSTPNTFMRAPGESIGTFVLESALDELAYELKLDPVELRMRNDATRDPHKNTEFSSRHLKEAYALGAEKFGWSNRPLGVRATRNGEWLVGQATATAYYPMYRLQTSARVRLAADGTAVIQTSAQEMGMGTWTAQAQHAAELLRIPMDRVRFEYGDSTLPAANQAGGSSQTVSIAMAVQVAYEKVSEELNKLAKDVGMTGASFADVLTKAGKSFIEADARAGPAVETLKYSMHSFGAHFCEVRVSEVTGEVRINRWVAAFDAGRIVNPKLARSQFVGGIIMGIGMALSEETLFDERYGRVMNPNLSEYHVPVNADIPHIETHYLDMPDPHTPMGARGIGEIGITGVAAAIANAVYHATGKRIRDLPITLDKLLAR